MNYRLGGEVSEDMKPFYALGVNVANQVGSELKGILSKEEIDAMLAGFTDSMTNKVEDDRTLLMTYGGKINEILQERARGAVTVEKKKGEDYMVKYLLGNPRAVKTDSGMIYSEVLAGVGPQPTAASTVTVHYHGTLVDGEFFPTCIPVDRSIQPACFVTFCFLSHTTMQAPFLTLQ